eukprot:476763-Prorocentrum_minimum.AAC.1
MTVKAARVSGVSTLCWHASPSTMYNHSTAAEAECQGNEKQTAQWAAESRLADMDRKAGTVLINARDRGGRLDDPRPV